MAKWTPDLRFASSGATQFVADLRLTRWIWNEFLSSLCSLTGVKARSFAMS
jgi:hypothetical protein